jgi:hypothetical protein
VSEAKNVVAIRKWLAAHRPDVLETFDGIMAEEEAGNSKARAMFAFIAIGFAAGREYQRENPKDVET